MCRSPLPLLLASALIVASGSVSTGQASPPAESRTTLLLLPGPVDEALQPQTDPESAWSLSASVAAAEGASGTPLGLVEFFDDRESLGTASLRVTDDGIVATLGLVDIDHGVGHIFSAVYQGDDRFQPSQSDFLPYPSVR